MDAVYYARVYIYPPIIYNRIHFIAKSAYGVCGPDSAPYIVCSFICEIMTAKIIFIFTSFTNVRVREDLLSGARTKHCIVYIYLFVYTFIENIDRKTRTWTDSLRTRALRFICCFLPYFFFTPQGLGYLLLCTMIIVK